MSENLMINLLPTITEIYSSDNKRLDRLPLGKDNIFSGIIKNPLTPDKPVRERRCVELLCGMLNSIDDFQKAFLCFLAGKAEFDTKLIDNLNWNFETEYSIEGQKRIDLHIEGLSNCDDSKDSDVLWIVEVKILAGFHYSKKKGCQESDFDDSDENNQEEEKLESQLVHYDNWLVKQPANHKSGFVLSARNMKNDIPDNLASPWHPTTWLEFADFIKNEKFSSEHNVIIKHFRGFTKEYLERSANMELTFEKLAFLKAYWKIGKNCAETLDYLVSPIKKLLEESPLELTNIKKQKLYEKAQKQIYYSTIYKKGTDEIWLEAGIDEGLWVWIDSRPNLKGKQILRESFKKALGGYKIGSHTWEGPDEDEWTHISIDMPLTELLNKSDQRQIVIDFVETALKQLEEIKAVEIIKKCVEG